MLTASVAIFEEPRTASPHNALAPICLKCGADLSYPGHNGAEDSQQKIQELEAQIKILTLRATSAVERATDYEDALRAFTSGTNSPYPTQFLASTNTPYSTAPPTSVDPTPRPSTANPTARDSALQPPNSRLSRLLPTRRSTTQPPSSAPLHALPQPVNSPLSTPYRYPQTAGLAPTETDLLTALNHEQTLRLAAESQVSQTNDELEELTGQLFQQANEMVAQERRARAKLEERVKLLERRDGEKAKRLEVLEGRLSRIDRVRGLLIGREVELQ